MRALAGKGLTRRLIIGLLLAVLIIGALPMAAFADRPEKKSTEHLDKYRVAKYKVSTFETPVQGSSDKDLSIAGTGGRILSLWDNAMEILLQN